MFRFIVLFVNEFYFFLRFIMKEFGLDVFIYDLVVVYLFYYMLIGR